jgi:hypothetical protein
MRTFRNNSTHERSPQIAIRTTITESNTADLARTKDSPLMSHRLKTHNLLPKKLLAIRLFLNLTQVQIAESLQSVTPPQSGRSYNIKSGRISEYENGRRKPNLIVLLAYARLGRVHMELVADNRFTFEEFRKKLGKHKF